MDADISQDQSDFVSLALNSRPLGRSLEVCAPGTISLVTYQNHLSEALNPNQAYISLSHEAYLTKLILRNLSREAYLAKLNLSILEWESARSTWSNHVALCCGALSALVFAPPQIRIFLSYLQGWFTSCAWQVGFVSTTLFIAEQISGLIVLNHPSYVPKGWHIFLWMVFFSLFNLSIHTYGKRILPRLQAASGVAHILFFLIIVIVVLALSPKASSSFVWTKFENNGGWSSNGISFCIGLLLPAFSISGADGCVHMAEEIRNASWNIPRVFVYTLLVNGTMAFVIVVVCLYSITDLEQVLNTPTGFPIIQIFYNATQSYAATSILDLMMVSIQITCSLCLCAAASRLAWSFSRENGFPGSKFMSKVDPKFKVPLNAIYVSITFAIALSTIVIGSTVAIDAVVSLCTVAAFASYTLPIASFLWYRLTHTDIRYGPWRMGWYGPLVNAFALCWCIFFVVILPFPPKLPVTADNMNWSGPIFLAITILLTCDWTLRARHVYRGPVIEIDGVIAEDTAPVQELERATVTPNK